MEQRTDSSPGTLFDRAYFDGLCHRDLHLIDGRDAVIDTDRDAWKIGGRKHGDRDGKGEVNAHRDQGKDDKKIIGREKRAVQVGGRGYGRGAAREETTARSSMWNSHFCRRHRSSSSSSALTGHFRFIVQAEETPDVTTFSPSVTPLRICTRFPSRIPTAALCAHALSNPFQRPSPSRHPRPNSAGPRRVRSSVS